MKLKKGLTWMFVLQEFLKGALQATGAITVYAAVIAVVLSQWGKGGVLQRALSLRSPEFARSTGMASSSYQPYER